MYPANGGDTFLQNAGNQPKISNFYKTWYVIQSTEWEEVSS
jgi:hypothetical protein